MGCKLFLFTIIGVILTIALIPDTENIFGFDIRIDDQPHPNKIKAPLPDGFYGPLLANRLLSNADHHFVGELLGPESFAEHNGRVFTGLCDGRIVEVMDDHLRTVVHLDPEQLGIEQCKRWSNFGRCGRPLGLKFGSSGTLYFVDPHSGLYSLNVDTKVLTLIADKTKLNAKFLDDLVVIENSKTGKQRFYMSDATTKWDLYNTNSMLLEHDHTGRLISYDTETERVVIELDELSFPNGLELTDDQNALLLCSLTNRMILKYYFNGPNRGKVVKLTENLPGEPDNIKRSRDRTQETYWVALFMGRNQHNQHLMMDKMGKLPLVVRFLARIQRLAGFVIENIAKLSNSDFILDLAHNVKIGYFVTKDICKYGMAVEIDSNGVIINSLHSPDGQTCALSEVFELEPTETERHFLLGSAWNQYLGRLSINKSHLKTTVKRSIDQKPIVEEVKKSKPQEPKKVNEQKQQTKSESTKSTKTTNTPPTRKQTKTEL
ncbi:hypothetical protein RDWZM_007942 [Blomia tropicalis]|uniref:Strictosidine synthase conserved region domain-containing protein n=1 Tax=Blomia tropicalis TaxID=40697 RepID=A0A9Q0M3K9_BLOTA|nr:hypothetical protein RDWZM_007942 [Blomia tropicalis]